MCGKFVMVYVIFIDYIVMKKGGCVYEFDVCCENYMVIVLIVEYVCIGEC